MKKYLPMPFLLALLLSCQTNTNDAASQTVNPPTPGQERLVGGPCECCDAWRDGLPEYLTSDITIAPAGEPGEPLEVSGVIYHKDGKTPASGVILYLYHTDAEGNYSRGPRTSECARRHGLLRGWIKTDETGSYRFRTIRPASYPNTTVEQHIHATIKEPGLIEYWIDSYLFDDDPNLSEQIRNGRRERGGSGIMDVKKNPQGVWVARRDIVLGMHVPGY